MREADAADARIARLVAGLAERDYDAVTQCFRELAAGLPLRRRFAVDAVSSITQTAGASFTGGRSSPVYGVACSGSDGARRFIVKIARGGSSVRLFHSYVVESRFYSKGYAAALRVEQLALPRLLAFGTCPTSPPLPAEQCDRLLSSVDQATTFCFVMRDLTSGAAPFPEHSDRSLTAQQARAAVAYLGRWHATQWALGHDSAVDLWPAGAFWSHAVTPPTASVVSSATAAASMWAPSLRYIARADRELLDRSPSVRALGRRLLAARGVLDRFLSTGQLASASGSAGKKGGGKARLLAETTVVHGDFKAANMFFQTQHSDDDDSGAAPAPDRACAACDFQFVGPGLGARDLAYFLCWDHFAEAGPLIAAYVAALHRGLAQREINAAAALEPGGARSPAARSRAMAVLSRDAATLCQRHGAASATLHVGLAFAAFFSYHLLTRGFVCSTEGDIELVARVDAVSLCHVLVYRLYCVRMLITA